MEEYLENDKNLLVQVFAEFITFLYLTLYDSKSNKMLHNIFLESKRIHIRELSDFFSSDEKIRQKDDLSSSYFLATPIPLDVQISSNLRKQINKGTAHLTKKRGTFSVPNRDYIEASKNIIQSINRFMKELDCGNMSAKCIQAIKETNAVELQQVIRKHLVEVSIINALNGVEIDL